MSLAWDRNQALPGCRGRFDDYAQVAIITERGEFEKIGHN
jgi:hypothetical protein